MLLGPLIASIIAFGYLIWPRIAGVLAQASGEHDLGLAERFVWFLLGGWAILVGILIALPWLI